MPEPTDNKKPMFPKKFLWGASTAAHQVEGNMHNQWSVWEIENAKSLAAQAEYQYHDLPNWDRIKGQATDPANYISGLSSNHYELYEQDFDILERLNMNAFRFSVEWSWIEPEDGAWNVKAIAHYKTYVESLRKRGIEPVVTLFHYTMPVWFAELGGFEKRRNVKYFVRFAQKIVDELGSSVKFIITLNEPEVYAKESYLTGQWPPASHSFFRARRVVGNLLYAHKKTAAVIHGMSKHYKVSISKNSVYYYAGDDAWLSKLSARFLQAYEDDYFLIQTARHSDFLGINYYFANRVYGYRIHNPDDNVSDLGWDMNPAALEQALVRLHEKYKLPILITENGVADAEDEHRQWWITQTLMALNRAMKQGVNVIGYMHWSLLDNFEWRQGFWPRFGLVEVDYKTFKRTPRRSALWFGAVIRKFRS